MGNFMKQLAQIQDITCIKGENIDLGILQTDETSIMLYTKWMNDETIKKWMGYGNKIINADQIQSWINKERTEEDCIWSILETKSRRLIGTCSCRLKRGTKNAYIDVCIGHASDRNKHYGTEAIELITAFAFEDMNVHRIEVKINSENLIALQCFQSCGFIECGRLHEFDYFDGHYSDSIILEVLKKDWLSKRLLQKNLPHKNKTTKARPVEEITPKLRDISQEEEEILMDVPTDIQTDNPTET